MDPVCALERLGGVAATERLLRFTWRQVMYDPDWVLACLHSLA